MKFVLIIVFCLLLKGCESLKVLSYNIQHGANMQRVFNLSGTIETIKSINADIIGLQEGICFIVIQLMFSRLQH